MCCGASRAAGHLPQTSFLLGEEDGSAPRYVRVHDTTLLPGAPQQTYVRGSAVDQAIAEGKLEDVSSAALRTRSRGSATYFRVTLPNNEQHDFPAYATARAYAVRNDGVIAIISKEPEDG